MSDKKQETPKSKVYLNYIDGSKLKKYEFNLNDPNEIRQYNQALKLDEDKRNTYLVLLAKKKFKTNNDPNTINYHPQKLVDKRYDLSHHVYIQEEEKEELKKIKEEKKKLEKKREKATDEEKVEIDNEMKDLETREKIIEKNLEQEYDKDFNTTSSTSSSSKTSTTAADSKTTKEILKILKDIDDKYGSKLTEIVEQFKNTDNTKELIASFKDEMESFKTLMIENEKKLVAETVSELVELKKAKSILTLLNQKLKSSPVNIKKLAKDKYEKLSTPNKRQFVEALTETPTKEDQIMEALLKTSTGNLAAVSELLSKNPLTKNLALLFKRYWNQIDKTYVPTEVINYFQSSQVKDLLAVWDNFKKTTDKGKPISTNTVGINLRYKWDKESANKMTIYEEFIGTTATPFNKMITKLNSILEVFESIINTYNKAYNSTIDFNFQLDGEVKYPKDTSNYAGVKKFNKWDDLVKNHNLKVTISNTHATPNFVLNLRCNDLGALAIFFNGIVLTPKKGPTFNPTILPFKIFGINIDVDEPLAEMDMPLVKEEKEDSEEIDIDDLVPKEGEENESAMEELDGLGAMEDTQSMELIKSELQTIKSLLFTIIYKLNKKDKDKDNKKNNNKAGSYDWLFD